MKRYLAATLTVITFSTPSIARAEISTVQWQEMNQEFQAAYIQGMLAAVSAFGVTNHLSEPIAAGMQCLTQRKWTAQQIVRRFAPFLAKRPDLNKQTLPMAFLDYMLDACNLD